MVTSNIITHTALTADRTRNKDYTRSASIMATRSASTTSDKYAFVPTYEVINKLEDSGWEVKDWRETGAQKEDNIGFQKHIIRLRKQGQENKMLEVNEIIPEIVLTNSHDAGSAFNLMAGLFRCFCSNQCVVSESTIASHRVLHKGYNHEQILDAVYRIVEDTPKVIDNVNKYKNIQMSQTDRQLMGETALEMLYGEEGETDKWEEFDLSLSAEKLIIPRRSQDSQKNLWTTYNTIQEKFLQGGRFMVSKEEADYYNKRGWNNLNWIKAGKTKKIKAIDKDVKLNRALWTLTENQAELLETTTTRRKKKTL